MGCIRGLLILTAIIKLFFSGVELKGPPRLRVELYGKSGEGGHSCYHHNNVIMGAIVTQITSLTIVYSTIYSGADQRNIKAPRLWPLCGEFTKGQLRGKCFHLMT